MVTGTLNMSDYYYDNQTRRYLLQFMRIFSELQFKTGPDANGNYILSRIPIMYGDMSRQVAQIMTGNTENVMLSAPSMAVTIQKLELAPERRNDPMWVSKVQANERIFDNVTKTYGNEIGNRYSIERYMPVPYNLTFQLDIWTTNTDSKLQILEQILTIFNPGIQLQQTDNPFDWSSIFEVELIDTTWTNRNIPVGDSLDNDIASLQFKLPIWINPPARVTRQRLIEKIITRVFDGEIDRSNPDLFAALNLDAQMTFASDDLMISVSPYSIPGFNTVTLLHQYGESSSTLTWESITQQYGKITPGISKLRLRTDPNLDTTTGDIYGSVVPHPTDGTKLVFEVDIDTLPATISTGPIDQIIDPILMWPGNNLPVASEGQRYLIVSKDSDGEEPAVIGANGFNGKWGNLIAYENDIVMYQSGQWIVSFDSRTATANQYMIDKSDGEHYRFDGKDWVYSYLGNYNPVFWSIENLVSTP